MARHFALTVHLHDQRYHGAIDWPPAPARVFQALVAGAARGRHLPEEAARALRLLEELPPPLIAAPAARLGQRLSLYVPNNDLDAVEGKPDRVDEVRAKKMVQPRLLESDAPFLYAWPIPDDRGDELPALANGLYQLGRGIDPAWAVGAMLDDEQLGARIRLHRGTVHRPTAGQGSNELAVPTTNSLTSILRRYDATLVRLRPGKDGITNFVQPPKAHFAMVRYDGTPTLHLFELRRESEPERSSPWASWRATALVEHVRDMAVDALSRALPDRKADIERVLVGRRPDGTNGGRIEERVRFIPLPSIGHGHADQSVRRIVVQVPPGPLVEADILWAVSGRSIFDLRTDVIEGTTLVAAESDPMVERYRSTSRRWRSVTPLALTAAKRRRIEPKRRREEAKSASERDSEERSAREAVGQALRHAGVDASLVRAHVQREPFHLHGARADRFAEGTRFAKETLWHVEIELDHQVQGPLVLGDGRFLGLGVMAPVSDAGLGVHAFHIVEGLGHFDRGSVLTRALRRAVMARVQRTRGAGADLPPFFTGHERHSRPERSDHVSHLTFAFDLPSSRLLVISPHWIERRAPDRYEVAHLRDLDHALDGFTELLAGAAGRLRLRADRFDAETDALFARAREWSTAMPYVVTRHPKKQSAIEALASDVRVQLRRFGLPEARVEAWGARGVAGLGLVGNVRLIFDEPVAGPIFLGKDRHFGSGMFRPSAAFTSL